MTTAYARGGEGMPGAYRVLDMVPNVRDENGPSFSLMYRSGTPTTMTRPCDESTGRFILSNDSGTCCTVNRI
jgi:hypothetical protein